MRKIFTIAVREYRAMVGTKAFAFSIIMMPILMGGSLLAMKLLSKTGKIQERTVAVIDHTGQMLPALKMAARINNVAVEDSEGETDGDEFSLSKGSKYTLEPLEPADVTEATRFELSERIRRGELYAFVEIPDKVHEMKPDGSLPEIQFYSEDSGISDSKRWVSRALNDRILALRLQNVGIDYAPVKQAQLPVRVVGLGLLEKTPDGDIKPAEEKDELTAIFLPMGVMMLMFMITFLAAQPMLEAVLEEKSQRIAEVLLGSANPSQIMAGKLLGTVGGSLTVFGIYMAGAFFFCQSQGYLDVVPFEIVPWFVIFQICGVLFYASIFMAVGSTVSQLKEAQSMLLPVWMFMMIPMFVWIFVVQEPNGTMATWLSLFPPATPSMMVLRMATGATIPLWQPLAGIVLLALATALVVFIAGRIFRIGILWQGKTPKAGELMRWALTG